MESRDTYRGRMRTSLAGDCRGAGGARSNWDARLCGMGNRCYFPCGNESASSRTRGCGNSRETPARSRRTNGRDSKNVPAERNDRVGTVRRDGILLLRCYFAEQLKARLKTAYCLILPSQFDPFVQHAQFFPRVSLKGFSLFSFSFFFVFNLARLEITLFSHCVKTIAKIIKELVRRRTARHETFIFAALNVTKITWLSALNGPNLKSCAYPVSCVTI